MRVKLSSRVLTSDTEELAEMMADRSLEKYEGDASTKSSSVDTSANLDDGEDDGSTVLVGEHSVDPQTPIGRTGFRFRPVLRSYITDIRG
ncbi:hypothetical protein FRC12_021654 [Ceratobasidium sp. 428]|nr:hypothetical protein FRC12_021654 [Ceratobasidium sp. 428]